MTKKKDNLSDLATELNNIHSQEEDRSVPSMVIIDTDDDDSGLDPGQVFGSQGEVVTLQPNRENMQNKQIQNYKKK